MSTPRHPLLVIAFQSVHEANGGVSSLLHLLSNLREFVPLLVTQVASTATARWAEQGRKVEVWPVATSAGETNRISRWERARSIVSTNIRVYRYLRGTNARVVHCNDLYALIHCGVGARLARAGVVHNIRGTLGVGGAKWTLARLVASKVIVLSEEMRRFVEQKTAPPRWIPARWVSPVQAVYSIVDFRTMHALDAEGRKETREELGIQPEEFAVGLVGAIVSYKQQLEFILALAKFRTLLPPHVRFWFVGDFFPDTDPYSRACLNAVAEQSLGDLVRFVGFTANIARFYQSLDCVLCASAHEGLARAMIESLSCGTGVISFDVASAREILEGHSCGLVIKQGDYESLLAAVAAQARSPGDWQQVGRRAELVARELFDTEKIVAKYERVYAGLMPHG